MTRAIQYKWDGEAMWPGAYFKGYMAEHFTPGTTYVLGEVELRNMNAHRGFFAALNAAWENLSEADAERFPSAEHLRKWALTFTPFCRARSYHAPTLKEAERITDWLRRSDEYCRVDLDPETKVVWQFIPDSQAMQAMPNNRKFMASMQAVMVVLAQKLGVDVDALWEAGRNAA